MMVFDVAAGDSFRAGRAAPLFDPWPYNSATPQMAHDVLADGSFVSGLDADVEVGEGGKSLSFRLANRNRVSELHVVLNFFDELRARVGR